MGLKGIPSIISPELLKLLAEMGHGDTIGKFLGETLGNNLLILRAMTECSHIALCHNMYECFGTTANYSFEITLTYICTVAH